MRNWTYVVDSIRAIVQHRKQIYLNDMFHDDLDFHRSDHVLSNHLALGNDSTFTLGCPYDNFKKAMGTDFVMTQTIRVVNSRCDQMMDTFCPLMYPWDVLDLMKVYIYRVCKISNTCGVPSGLMNVITDNASHYSKWTHGWLVIINLVNPTW